MRSALAAILLSAATVGNAIAEEKPLKRQEQFPEGKQTSGLIGSFMSGAVDVNVVEHTFPSPYAPTWAAACRTARKFDKVGRRMLVYEDSQNGRIQSGVINQNSLIGMGPGAWLDTFTIEVTEVSPTSSKVVIARKVVEKQMTGDRPWKTVWSNSKIERWLLTQIEDDLKNPAAAPVVSQAPAAGVPGLATEIAPRPPSMTNDDVLRMVEAKLSDAIILTKIRNSPARFDTSTESLIKLKQAGVSDAVIQAMAEK